MKENVSGKILWNEAGKAGLVLGLIPAIYTGLSELAGLLSSSNVVLAFLISVLKFLLWAAKFGGCIWAMSYFMKKFVRDFDNVTNRDTFRFGTATALLSALIVAAISMALTLLTPDVFNEVYDAMLAQYSTILDSDSLTIFEGLRDKLGTLSFFSNLAYCFMFGLALSAILSRNIPSRDPFAQDSDN